jgi:transcriptional regulator with XRE-family HTH domain
MSEPTLATVVRRLRTTLGLSQAMLADLSGISAGTIKKIEAKRDPHIPKADTLRALSDGFAKDRLTGAVNRIRADELYVMLMRAAGHHADGEDAGVGGAVVGDEWAEAAVERFGADLGRPLALLWHEVPTLPHTRVQMVARVLSAIVDEIQATKNRRLIAPLPDRRRELESAGAP